MELKYNAGFEQEVIHAKSKGTKEEYRDMIFLLDYLATALEDSAAYYGDELADANGESKVEGELVQEATVYNISPQTIQEVKETIAEFKKLCKEQGLFWDTIQGGDLYMESKYGSGLWQPTIKRKKDLESLIHKNFSIYEGIFRMGDDGYLFIE